MIDVVVWQVRDWLEDPLTGVNAQILALPVSGAPDPPLQVDRVYAETDHAWVARVFQGQAIQRSVTQHGPVLLIGASNEVAGELRVDTELGGRLVVNVAICYAGRNDRSEELVRDARQTFRACLRAIAAQFADDLDREVRRGGVGIEQPTNWRVMPLVGAHTDDVVYGALILSIPTTDPWSLAIDAG